MDFHLTWVIIWSNRAEYLGAAARPDSSWVVRNSYVSANKHTFLLKLKWQFSPAIDSDDFNQLKEAKRADGDDKLHEVIALWEAA